MVWSYVVTWRTEIEVVRISGMGSVPPPNVRGEDTTTRLGNTIEVVTWREGYNIIEVLTWRRESKWSPREYNRSGHLEVVTR